MNKYINLFFRRIVGGGSNLFIAFFLAKTLSIEDFGDYNLFINNIHFFVGFFILGVDVSLIYFLNSKGISNVSIVNSLFYFLIFLLSLLVILGSVQFFYFDWSIFNVALLVILIFCNIFLLVFYSYLLSQLKVKAYSWISFLPNLFFLLQIIFVYYFYFITIKLILVLFLVSQIIPFFFVFNYFKKFSISSIYSNFNFQEVKLFFKYGISIYSSNVLSFLNNRGIIFIIASILGSSSLGLYSFTLPISEALWLISMTLASLVVPIFSRKDLNQEDNLVIVILSKYSFYITFMLGLILLFFLYTFKDIQLFKKYSDSIFLFEILLPGIAAMSAARLFCTHLTAVGSPKVNIYINFYTLLLGLPLIYVLSLYYRLEGACFGLSLSYIFFFFLSIFYHKKYFFYSLNLLIFPAVSDIKKVLLFFNDKK
jgi:O-antigen/teichoic acid export membrane protein